MCIRDRGVGIEASPAAAALARANVQKSGLLERAEITVSEWQDSHGWSEWDLIISNPPYIETAVIDSLQPEVRLHDPHVALDGGVDGLDAYRSIFACGENIRSGTPMVLEIGFDQGDSVPELATSFGFKVCGLQNDLGGNPRAVMVKKTSEK